ncbi:MAG: radical SAM protein [archaeon]
MASMKVLLINPPETSEKGSLTVIGLPLGLMYIGAVLEKSGKNVSIFDSITFNKSVQTQEYFGKRILIGASWKRIEEEIRKQQPDIVGISNHFSSQFENAVIVSKIAKKVNEKIITVVGGPHASCKPLDFLNEKSIDFVMMGEGEYAFDELVNSLENNKDFSGINNLAYRKNGEYIINQKKEIAELDSIPFPAYHLINMNNYFRISRNLGRVSAGIIKGKRVSVITSRGCPYNCSFCSIHSHMGRKWRAHSAEYVIKHIEYLISNFAVSHISFEDDNLVLDTQRLEKILDWMNKENVGITWDTPNGIRADRVNYEILKKMKRAGCSSLKVGVESGDQDFLNRFVGKNLDLKKVVEIADSCKMLNIPLTGFFIIGFPEETKSNIKNTLDFAYMLKKRYYADSVITIAMPLIGTEIYRRSKEKNYLVKGHNPSEFGSKDSLVIETENFNVDYLKSERNRFYQKVMLLQIYQFILKPKLLLRYSSLLKNPKNTLNIISYLTKK